MHAEQNKLFVYDSSTRTTMRKPTDLGKLFRKEGWTWASAGAFFGLSGGIISPVLGSLLTATAWFTGPVYHGLAVGRDGTILLFLTIPLLIFGAHCLDLMDRKGHSKKSVPQSSLKNVGGTGREKSNDLGGDKESG